MYFERITSEGLAHHSYLIASPPNAVVIDPRRDVQVYIDLAAREGLQIQHILETHRNEDYVIGSAALAAQTDAQIWHADAEMDYRYGTPVEDGQSWDLGDLRIEALATPGHTPGSMSYLLYDEEGNPWMLFSGDLLFAGDVGRLDLLGEDRMHEMAGLSYDSIFGRVLPLGDHVILCPAHGAGSVCGMDIVDRQWTTLGMERKYNPVLQHTERDDYIEAVAHIHPTPPYFRKMERLNLIGPVFGPGEMPQPQTLKPRDFQEACQQGQVLDTRSTHAFGTTHLSGALSIEAESVASYAGWFLSYDSPIYLVEDGHDLKSTLRTLFRMGFDDVAGRLYGGMGAWHEEALPAERMNMMDVDVACRVLDQGSNPRPTVLDVRREEELEESGHIRGAVEVPLFEIPDRLDDVPSDVALIIFCGTGMRSTIAGSLLQRAGRDQLHIVMGGMTGWNSTTCPREGGMD